MQRWRPPQADMRNFHAGLQKAKAVEELERLIESNDHQRIRAKLRELVPKYNPASPAPAKN